MGIAHPCVPFWWAVPTLRLAAFSKCGCEGQFWLGFGRQLRGSWLLVFHLTIFERLTQHGQLLAQHAESFAFCSGVSLQQLVELQSPFDMHRGAFSNSSFCEVGLLAHHSNFDERRFFSTLIG